MKAITSIFFKKEFWLEAIFALLCNCWKQKQLFQFLFIGIQEDL